MYLSILNNVKMLKQNVKKLKELIYNIDTIKLQTINYNSYQIIGKVLFNIIKDCDLLINNDYNNNSLNFVMLNFFKYTRIYTTICENEYESKIFNKKQKKNNKSITISLGIGTIIIIGSYHISYSYYQSLLIGGLSSKSIYYSFNNYSIKRSLVGLVSGILIGLATYKQNKNKNNSLYIGAFFGNMFYTIIA